MLSKIVHQFILYIRYEHNAPTHPSRAYKYQTVECVFNNKTLFANIQADESVARTIFEFNDKVLWKQLAFDPMSAIKPYHCTFRNTNTFLTLVDNHSHH